VNSDCGQSCLVLDEFLDSVVYSRRVKGILRFREVRGELVDNVAARGFPQKGDILVVRRRVRYSVGSFVVWIPSVCTHFHVVWIPSVCTHFHEEVMEAQIDPVV